MVVGLHATFKEELGLVVGLAADRDSVSLRFNGMEVEAVLVQLQLAKARYATFP